MKKLNFIDFIIAISIVVIIALAVFLLSLLKINPLSFLSFPSLTLSGTQVKYSPDLLFLSPPVNTITGNVDRITNDTLWVSKSYSYNGQTKSITFEIKTNTETKITKSSESTINTIYNTTGAIHTPISLASIKVGDMASISTTTDIRIISKDHITAQSISVIRSATH